MKISNIKQELLKVKMDHKVWIKHTYISKGQNYWDHIAEIKDSVQAHIHNEWDEFYHILEGTGLIYIWKYIDNSVQWKEPKRVFEGDVFLVPAWYGHSLKNIGENNLIISFICPHSHLDSDRIIVNNPE